MEKNKEAVKEKWERGPLAGKIRTAGRKPWERGLEKQNVDNVLSSFPQQVTTCPVGRVETCPDLYLNTGLSQRSTESSSDLLAWLLSWHAVWIGGLYIDRYIFRNDVLFSSVCHRQAPGTFFTGKLEQMHLTTVWSITINTEYLSKRKIIEFR